MNGIIALKSKPTSTDSALRPISAPLMTESVLPA